MQGWTENISSGMVWEIHTSSPLSKAKEPTSSGWGLPERPPSVTFRYGNGLFCELHRMDHETPA